MDEYLQRAFMARGQEQLSEAMDWYNRLLTLNPNSLPAVTGLADLEFKQGNCAAVVPLLNRALGIINTGVFFVTRLK